ncbi:MAG: hypothetical protein SOX97_00820 [Sutterella sp.]|nr:hypothetical protein [Sutterella sp.]
MPASIGARGRGCPITPVEAMMTSSAGMPEIFASMPHMASATFSPSGAQVLALPELQSIACAKPSARCALVTAMGAPLTAFLV